MSLGRTYRSLHSLQKRAALEAHEDSAYWKKDDPRRYEGLEECRKNVVKCNCAYKLKYCVER